MIPKFRAWDRYEEAMTEQDGIYFGAMDNDETLGSLLDCLEERYELMQSTGLKDKNEVEIFEGDLVEHEDNINGHWETFEACEVVYDKDCAQFCFKDDAGNFLTDYRNLNVIGNIYENPYLLEAE